jgi:3D (Asp-Asp-Asp) domain-containing protein
MFESLFLYPVKSPVMERPVIAIVTAYNSEVKQTDSSPTVTASGKLVGKGVIACPRNLPFRTEVIILGQIYTCQDRMALKNDGKFDIWMSSRQEALKFGRQKLEVKIKL